MKKTVKILGLLLALFMCVSALAFAPALAADEGADGGTLKIGMSLADYTNPVWADVSKGAEEYCKENGAEFTAVQFDNDPQKQVSQIENFVASGFDAIIACPTDSGSIEDACKRAMEKGVVVVIYTSEMENMTCNYNLNEYDSGYACGELAAEWAQTRDAVMDKDTVQIGVCNYRQIPQTIGREDGFEAAITEVLPQSEIVIRAEALTTEEGMSAAENFFQAYPDLDMIFSIGGGGGMGSNEAAKTMNKATDDFGIFCVDSTQEICQAIKNGDPLRAIIGLGTGRQHGIDMVELALKAIRGEEVERLNFMPIVPITKDNVEEIAVESGYTLK